MCINVTWMPPLMFYKIYLQRNSRYIKILNILHHERASVAVIWPWRQSHITALTQPVHIRTTAGRRLLYVPINIIPNPLQSWWLRETNCASVCYLSCQGKWSTLTISVLTSWSFLLTFRSVSQSFFSNIWFSLVCQARWK